MNIPLGMFVGCLIYLYMASMGPIYYLVPFSPSF